MVPTVCRFFLLLSAITLSSGQSLMDLDTAYAVFTANSNYPFIIPLQDSTNSLTVTIDMELTALNNYDEISGSIQVAAFLNVTWRDERLLELYSKNFKYAKTSAPIISEMVFPYTAVWHPSIKLLNSVDTVIEIGDEAYKIRENFERGTTTWIPRVILTAACNADVTYYPFDVQECSFLFTTWDYSSDEIRLQISNSKIGLTYYEDNGKWKMLKTSTSAYIANSKSFAKFTVIIQRRSLYYMINIVLPTILLGVINGFVFLLPAASGERVGFSITCFLSFIVLLNMIMGFLPRTSYPLSLLCYYVTMMLMFSTFITLTTILTLRIYHKADDGEKIPNFMAYIVAFLTCKCNILPHVPSFRRINPKPEKIIANIESGEDCTSKKKIPPIDGRIQASARAAESRRQKRTVDEKEMTKVDVPITESTKIKEIQMTWKDFGKLLDTISFIGFLAVQGVFTFCYLVPLGVSYYSRS
ncbi:hypothetical protein ACJMK2_030335 [Sinanodonta woodiana]|uniref:Uncharacterized protein n=1 Tax=Sinanodonta woodiana TaxID=1069815 RepID=A0ABD3XGU5_SINWO